MFIFLFTCLKQYPGSDSLGTDGFSFVTTSASTFCTNKRHSETWIRSSHNILVSILVVLYWCTGYSRSLKSKNHMTSHYIQHWVRLS